MDEGRVPWPVILSCGPVTLRPLRRRDARDWQSVRSVNAHWLGPWEATQPEGAGPATTFGEMVRAGNRAAAQGRMFPFAIDVDGRLRGQLTVGGIQWGSLRSGHVGYWVDERVAGRGVTPTAVAMAADHCFGVVGLHRLEVNIRPENRASLRVVEKLDFRSEGLRRRFLHIDGAWRDHLSFALTLEEWPPGGLLGRLRTKGWIVAGA
ncbi:MAG: GNAT family protein [Kineosporiaceae bacterium]